MVCFFDRGFIVLYEGQVRWVGNEDMRRPKRCSHDLTIDLAAKWHAGIWGRQRTIAPPSDVLAGTVLSGLSV